jgi:pimeloyl-ACP methyl ester carboxylesterase
MTFCTTSTLQIAYETGGPADGGAVMLLHGWPDDIRTYDKIVPALHEAGFRTFVPYLRGFGGTSFLSADAKRSGEIVAMAQDAIDLADALQLNRFAVVGHDWGARIAYVLAIVAPERVQKIVAISVGWQPGDLPTPGLKQAQAYWYQWFLTTERGREAMRNNREMFARVQWENWSPAGWFTDEDFKRTAKSFENPDWPEITWHSYSVRWGEAEKDPAYFSLDQRVREAKTIGIDALLIQGKSDAVTLPETTKGKDHFFSGRYARRVIPDVGHFPTREAPAAVSSLVNNFLRG